MTGPYPNSPVLPSLADHLQRVGMARDRASRRAAFEALARAAAEAGRAPSLLLHLLERDANGQRFALEIAARLIPPLPGEVIPELVALIEQSRFPTRLRIAVAAAIIRSVGRSQLVDRIIDIFQRQVSPVRAANR